MQEEKKDKDPKSLYHWDDDTEKTGKEAEPVKKKSKKVTRREAKERQKKRKKEMIKELQKSKLTKKGRMWIIIGSSVVAVAIIVALLLSYFLIGFDFSRTLAEYDDMKVTQREVNVYMNFLKNQDPGSIPSEDDPQYEVLEANILDSIIVLKILKKYGKENGFVVTEAEINEEYSKIASSYPSMEDFENDLKNKKISESFLKEQISDQLLRDKIFDSATEDIAISEEEIRQYYDDNDETLFMVPRQRKVSHILIEFNVPEGGTLNDAVKEEARGQIEDIERRLSEGADFAELAEEYSQDEVSAENGGEIGFISEGQTVPEFEEVAFSLEVGEVSPIVETYYGYHLIKVLEEKDAYMKDFEEVREDIESYLLSNRKVAEWQDFVYSLVDSAQIEYTTDLKGQLVQDVEIPESVEPAEGTREDDTEES